MVGPMSSDRPWDYGFRESAEAYQSAPQRARVWSEAWVSQWLYCPGCGAERISRLANNRPVADFVCEQCSETYELKSQKRAFGAKVVDGAFKTMTARLASDTNPNLILLNYDLASLSVTNLIVVPKQFFTTTIIEERRPLAVSARRAGWVGCNILLREVPVAGRIEIVRDGARRDKGVVLADWRRTLFLRDQKVARRGWLIEVMRSVDALARAEFSLADVYADESRLAAVFPENRNVRPKIRQQLQVLRDAGYLEFLGDGNYRLRPNG